MTAPRRPAALPTLLAALLLLPAALLAREAAPTPGLAYEEVLTGGATAAEPLPLVIAIHGLGDRPDRFAGLWKGLPVKARVILPRAPIPWGDGGSWFEPKRTERARRELAAAADRVIALADALTAAKPTVGRPVVTGFSQGGILSFVVAVRAPGTFAAAVPIGGRLPRAFHPEGRAPEGAPPIRAFHGAADRRLPVAPTAADVAVLKARGWDATLETYEGVGHRIPPAMRRDVHAAIAAAVAAAAQ